MFKIKGGFKDANRPMTIRFTEKLYYQLGKMAQKNGISFNSLVLQCCRYALDNQKTEQKDDK